MFIFLYLYLICFSAFHPSPAGRSEKVAPDSIKVLYRACGASRHIPFSLFKKSVKGFLKFQPRKSILAIADMSKPSDQKRLFVFDLKERKMLEATWVAHGRNSGMRKARLFSNKPNSYQTSPGFYLVGNQIYSPKHGQALVLDGLEKGINDKARQREIIMHGAEYVAEDFIRKYGRCGRSHGCPAVAPEMIKKLAPVLQGGSLLYINAAGKFSDSAD